MLLGRHQQTTARPSLIVTGPAPAGKTTALLEAGRTCHLAHTCKHPAPPGRTHQQIPVTYLLVPPAATAKTLATGYARYLGIPLHPHDPDPDHRGRLPHPHHHRRPPGPHRQDRLNPRTTTGTEAADLLKDLTERIHATLVDTGIDVASTTLIAGVRGAQPAGHAVLITCGPLPARHANTRPFTDHITDHITGMDNAPDLTQHTPGTLPRHASYLHQPTAGRIGSLSRLIRQAATTAICDGTEHITKKTLDAIQLDHLAEEASRPRTRHPSTTA